MNSILQLIEDRIRQFKEKRENLKQVKGTYEQRHYIQGKLNELSFLKKKIKENKFPNKCPVCGSNLSILSSTIDLPDKSNLPASKTPICWPYSQNEKGTIDSFQKLTVQTRCTSCGKYFNAKYVFDDFKEVQDEASIWYDQEKHIEEWKKNINKAVKDHKQPNKYKKAFEIGMRLARRRIYWLFKGK